MIKITYANIGVTVTLDSGEDVRFTLESLGGNLQRIWEETFVDMIAVLKGSSEYNADDRIAFTLELALLFDLDEDCDHKLTYDETVTYSNQAEG